MAIENSRSAAIGGSMVKNSTDLEKSEGHGVETGDDEMRFSVFYEKTPAEAMASNVREALLANAADIGKHVQVDVRISDTPLRIDFDLSADGIVNADAALDIVEAINGVKRAIFRRVGKTVRATITGPHSLETETAD